MISPLVRDWMHHVGVGCLVVAVVMSVAALAAFATGFEPAFLAMVAALGLFTLGIGALAVARR